MPKPIPSPAQADPQTATGGVPRPPGSPPSGSDWEKRPAGKPAPRHRLRRYRLGVGFGVVTIYMLFLGLASAFIIRQSGYRSDDPQNPYVMDWQHIDLPSILYLNTILLAVSSITVELARRQVFLEPDATKEWLGMGRPIARRTLPWMGITILLGLGFLGGQAMAWQELYARGAFFASNPSSSFFFLLTGLHALHLFGGLLALAWAVLTGLVHSRFERRQIAIDVSAWFWHAMGVLWLALFLLLRFGQ